MEKFATYFVYGVVSQEWYESFDKYVPDPDCLEVLRSVITTDWRIGRRGIWINVAPEHSKIPQQGWKIHVSATPSNYRQILKTVARLCKSRKVTFKCLLDGNLVRLSSSKAWPRESSGKFITIYPSDLEMFLGLLEELNGLLGTFKGPYILSDRRYKTSGVLFYRYGGFLEMVSLTSYGERVMVIKSPEGELMPDRRLPYWNPPTWIRDPIRVEDKALNPKRGRDPLLNNGRYKIDGALNFSNSGGVYFAVDLDSGQRVILKEARPMTGIDSHGRDACDRLRHEHHLLKLLEGLGVTPRPIELFEDWEHLYLAEEYILGMDLGRFTIVNTPLGSSVSGNTEIDAYTDKLKVVWVGLAKALAKIHSAGVVCGDLSLKNIIFNVQSGALVIVDLEGAWLNGIEDPMEVHTPGYCDWEQVRRSAMRGMSEDLFGMASIMLGTMLPISGMLDLDKSSGFRFAKALGSELGVPTSVQHFIGQFLTTDPSERPSAREALDFLVAELPRWSKEDSLLPDEPSINLEELLSGICEYLLSMIDISHDYRLAPSDLRIYQTNSLSVAYGAFGIAYALKKLGVEIPQKVYSWLLSRSIMVDDYGAGLYLGLSGVAWSAWEIGLEDFAVDLLKQAVAHPSLHSTASVWNGIAGVGVTCLKFFQATNDARWLEEAVRLGDLLAEVGTNTKDGCTWPDTDNESWIGYAKGSSGVALFLLYLGVCTQSIKYIQIGLRALDFDLAHLQPLEDQTGLSTPRGPADKPERVLSQYWFDGSAGIVTVLARFIKCGFDRPYSNFLERLIPDITRRFTVFPHLFNGMAGLGNVQLDLGELFRDPRFKAMAMETANRIALYAIPRKEGIAFPGDQLFRISNDFGNGAAGIALFLARLTGKINGNFNFVLDNLLLDNNGLSGLWSRGAANYE